MDLCVEIPATAFHVLNAEEFSLLFCGKDEVVVPALVVGNEALGDSCGTSNSGKPLVAQDRSKVDPLPE